MSGGNSAYLFVEGLARYRERRFGEAIKLMNGEGAPGMGPCLRLVLAMAQYQQGQKEEASEALAAATFTIYSVIYHLAFPRSASRMSADRY